MTDAPAGPLTSYGTELRVKKALPYIGFGIATVFSVCSVAVARGETPGMPRAAQLGAAAFLAVVLVAIPLVGGVVILRRRIIVAADAVHVFAGRTLVATLRWGDVEHVRAAYSRAFRTWTRRSPELLLTGRASAGRRAGKSTRVLTGVMMYHDFDLVLAAAATEVRRRPEVVPNQYYRYLFALIVDERLGPQPPSTVV